MAERAVLGHLGKFHKLKSHSEILRQNMYLSVVCSLQLLHLGHEGRVEGEAGALLVRRLLVALQEGILCIIFG